MYFETQVDIPVVPGKIIISKNTYVKYETGRKYDPRKKYNVPKRVTIGKLCKGDDGKMYPTEKFLAYFQSEKIEEKDGRSKRSCCLRIGTYLVIKKILKEYGLDKIINKIFAGDGGLFMDLLSYSIVEEKNAGQYYPDYAYTHPLFTQNHHIYSDATVSRFLSRMTDDQRIEFINMWNDGREHNEQIYISYDSTNKNCQAGDIDLAEYGHAKDNKNEPIINYSIGYDHTNREPLFYEEYPGSIVDVSQLDYMISKAEGYGYYNIGFILDRGYFSKGNIRHLDERDYAFIIMVKGCAAFINGFVKQVVGKFENDRKTWINKYHVYGKTIKTKLFSTDERDRYIHVYYNRSKAAAEQERFESKIDILDRNYRKLIGTKKETNSFEKYFRFERDKDGVIAAVMQKNTAIENEKKLMGYFVIVTSNRMKAKDALHLYKSRDESEKLFKADKTFLGNGAFRNSTDEAIGAKSLIEFVALIVRNRIFTCLDNAIEEGTNRQNYMTVPAAIKELEKIEMSRQSDGVYRLDHAVTATQKVILTALGITPSTIPNKAKMIADELVEAK